MTPPIIEITPAGHAIPPLPAELREPAPAAPGIAGALIEISKPPTNEDWVMFLNGVDQ